MGCGASKSVVKVEPSGDAAPEKAQPSTPVKPGGLTKGGLGKSSAHLKVSGAVSFDVTTGHVMLTSNGFSTDVIQLAFTHKMLERSKVTFDKAMPLVELLATHRGFFETLKVLVISDPIFFRSQAEEEGYMKEHPDWFLHTVLLQTFGVKEENMRIVQLYHKPWVTDADERKHYTSLLALAQEEYVRLVTSIEGGPEAGDLPGKDRFGEPAVLAEGTVLADEIYAESVRLDTKYAAECTAWMKANLDDVGLIAGNGGDVVIANMNYQINAKVRDAIVDRIRGGGALYVGRSSGTMVVAKSMEMSAEVTPEWVKVFSCNDSYKASAHFEAVDLDNDGVHTSVLGALPLVKCPIAMRPHFNPEKWSESVHKANLKAEAEFEAENAGHDVDDAAVASSGADLNSAVNIANHVAISSTQDNPVFLPILDGQAVLITIDTEGSEHFEAIGA